ncbi:MAG: DNA-packaging protein [Candidatus Ornithomonoglobus sp.]
MELNQKQLAEILGITARQVRNLKEQGLFEFTAGTKKYNAARCVQDYLAFKIKAETNKGTTVVKETEQAEHERLKKEITKIKLRKLRKEVHEAADVERYWSDMLQHFHSYMLSIPSKIAPKILDEADINKIINELTEEILTALDTLAEYDPDAINSDSGESCFEDEDGETEDDE